MKHLNVLAFAVLLVACDADVRLEGSGGAPVARTSPAVDSAIPSVTTSADESVVAVAAAPASKSDSSRDIRLRLLAVIDDASLQSEFLHRVRNVAVRDDGSIVVAHQGERVLLWLDANGRLIRSMGRQGSGPGEFRSGTQLPPDLAALPDGVVAWDLGVRRLTFYSSTGELLRTSSLPSLSGRLLGLVSDKEAVFGGINFVDIKPREYFGVDLESGEITWRWTGPPARTVASIRFQSGTLSNGRPRFTNWGLPDCVPVGLAGAWQGQLFLVDASAGTIHALPIAALQDGLREEPIHRARDRPPMNGIAERYVSERIAAASPPEKAAGLKSMVSEDGYLPTWKEFVLGSDGTLFLERTTCGELPDARFWEVLTPEGELLGSLTTPTRAFRILAGARNRIVALVEDSLGVQRIEIHALEIERP